jgi:hypothetical protein
VMCLPTLDFHHDHLPGGLHQAGQVVVPISVQPPKAMEPSDALMPAEPLQPCRLDVIPGSAPTEISGSPAQYWLEDDTQFGKC